MHFTFTVIPILFCVLTFGLASVLTFVPILIPVVTLTLVPLLEASHFSGSPHDF
jgi:hypothetical protein